MTRRGFFGMLSTVLAAAKVKAPDPAMKPLKILVAHKDRSSAVNFYSRGDASSTTITIYDDSWDSRIPIAQVHRRTFTHEEVARMKERYARSLA